MKSVDINSPCPISGLLSVFGGKWKPSILYHLEQESPLRFGELRRRIPLVSQKMLTQQLRELERDGMVKREQFQEIPLRVEYSSTALALSLTDIFQSIEKWGNKKERSIHKARKMYDEI